MTRHIAFLESNLTGSGYEAIRAAHRSGYRVTFLTRDFSLYVSPGHDRLDRAWTDEIIVCETNDPDSVVNTVRQLSHPVDALIAVGEWHMICAARASEKLGLPGPSPAGVLAARDKSRTRALCASEGIPVPGYARVTSPGEVHEHPFVFPCVVKPLDDGGSNGVKLCRSADEAAEHVRTLLEDTHNERGQRKIPAALVEEYVEGGEVSVEALVNDGELTVAAVTWKELGELPHFTETGHHVPAALGGGLDELCAEVATRAVRAIGFDLGAVHVELRLAADGPRLIEVNCRPAGDRITRLVELSTGVSIPAELIEMHFPAWEPPRPGLTEAAAIAFLPAAPGTVTGVDNIDETRAAKGVVDVSLYVSPGDHSEPPVEAGARHGHVITTAPSGPEALRRARTAVSNISVRTSNSFSVAGSG